jgi:hypothetical protein
MFAKKKYRLLPKESVSRYGDIYEVHRIQALIDIPLHGVKAGDLGGYVAKKKSLDHEGSCWVGGDAIVAYIYSENMVTGDSLVTDNALVLHRISGNVKVSGNAVIRSSLSGNCDISDNVKINAGSNLSGNITMRGNAVFKSGNIFAFGNSKVTISGDVIMDCPSIGQSYDPGNAVLFIEARDDEEIEISGKVNLTKVFIKGNCKLDGEFNLEDVSFSGDNAILGKPQIKPGVKFSGKNVISGDSLIPPGTHVHDVVMDTGILNYATPGNSMQSVGTGSSETIASEENQASSKYVALIDQIETEYEAYTTDIVKLIKYPAMVDASVPEVGEFLVKLRSAKRSAMIADESELKSLVEALEIAFVRAENKARTLVASHLDEGKKKSLKDAEKMFTLAFNEASPEPEKRLGYKAGMRALEGIVEVSDKATENIKTRIGILELES